jgi:tetratricopeptide (TPR) repeat protein
MAYHRLGRAGEARQALTEAAQKVDQWQQSLLGLTVDPMGGTWWDVLEGLVLYREAKILLEGSAPPDDPRPMVARAGALAALGERAKAAEACSRAVELAGTNLSVRLACARIHAGLGHWDKALADLPENVEAAPDKKSLPDFYFLRATANVQLRRFAEALADYAKAQELAPDSPVEHNALAWFLVTCPEPKFRDPRRAVELAKKGIKLAPKEANFWNTLGAAHYRAGDWQAATLALGKAREYGKGGNAVNFFFLAMTNWRLGQKNEALTWYKKAVEWLENNSELLANNPPWSDELHRFRTEAEELLQIQGGRVEKKRGP